jgi:hypothetical protein
MIDDPYYQLRVALLAGKTLEHRDDKGKWVTLRGEDLSPTREFHLPPTAYRVVPTTVTDTIPVGLTATELRTGFETWAKDNRLSLGTNEQGTYTNWSTGLAWVVWCAANGVRLNSILES